MLSVSNLNFCCYLGGGKVSNVQILQTGLKSVHFSWTPPQYLPRMGYRIFVLGHIYVNNYNRRATSYETKLPSGRHQFSILAISPHYPSMFVRQQFIVKG